MCKCEDSGFFRFFPLLFCLDVMSCWLSSSFFFVCPSSWWMLLKMALRKAQAKGWWWRWRQKAGGLKSCWREERGRGTLCLILSRGFRGVCCQAAKARCFFFLFDDDDNFFLSFGFRCTAGVTHSLTSLILLRTLHNGAPPSSHFLPTAVGS
uniref:(northern house mosquito) hypothetical protein n=1 Tax=Culex pipiens TaxID=7175 RepID=A0A8D8C706_CULPI